MRSGNQPSLTANAERDERPQFSWNRMRRRGRWGWLAPGGGRVYGRSMAGTCEVARRLIAVMSLAIAATLGTHEPLRGQLRIALNSGVTKDEIVELFVHLDAYTGTARAFDTHQIALAVFAER
jgi:Carboxymuconolactone decarboxylase family